jgi:hypothetical protein
LDLLELIYQILEPVVQITNRITDYEDYDFMPTSFFRRSLPHYDSERELYSVLQMEAFNQKGVNLEYFVISYDTEYNKVWGEDNDRVYLSAFNIMSYYELPEETEIWNKYSIEGIDTFHIYVNKLHFNYITGGNGIFPLEDGYEPKIGDFVRAIYNNYYYEIINVNHTEQMFLQFKHCWDLIVRPLKNEHIGI